MAQAFEQVWKSITGIPKASLAGKRYTFGAFDTDGTLKVAGATDNAIGVIYEPNAATQPTQVVASGFAFITLGAKLNPGTAVASDANGAAIAATEGAPVAGILAVGGDAGDLGTVLLK
jgi:hypothetical protein